MTRHQNITTQNALTFTKRPAVERGKADFGWLKSAHSFSFGQYYDPNHLGFGNLIVINDDLVDGGKGFGAHPHKNAEIFSYVMGGALEHKDSMGNGSVVGTGGVQYMSAGSGVTHSEFNPSATDEMRFLQVWLVPEVENTQPTYDTMDLTSADKDGKLKLFLSKDGRDGSMKTQADASVYAATLSGDQMITQDLTAGRKAWVQVAGGSVRVNEIILNKGDGLAIDGTGALTFDQGKDAEFLFFDLAP
ncbi:pirin family protein (plasmid) [Pseudorhodobacter turbinis]|uniref:Pirin family protein n=1 Tax=Pseudorhodobacter turbinis TaxID=2500533 RepID=A0A4P8EKR7_9RHOB|nr:pirin family protein [Pseudorhodobacter turbinis]QCO57830.1 pirin family protein [Pseudorhodobacter turbinis]